MCGYHGGGGERGAFGGVNGDRHTRGVAALNGAEQQAGFAVGDAINHADFAQDAVKIRQACRRKFGDEIPFAVGRMQAAQLGQPAEAADHGRCGMPCDLDHHDGVNPVGAMIFAGANGKAKHCAAVDQTVETVLYRGAGYAENLGQFRDRRTAILAQDSNESFVEVIKDLHNNLLFMI